MIVLYGKKGEYNEYDYKCSKCDSNKNLILNHDPISQYNYRCICGGEFNTPNSQQGIGTTMIYNCPFCGKSMEGI